MSRTATPQDVLEGRARWCVIEGDCRDVLPTLPQVDAVVTDPPYGINDAPLKCARSGRGGAINTWHPPSTWDAAIDPAWGPLLAAVCPVVAWFGQWRKRAEVEAAVPLPLRAEIVWAKDCHVGPPSPVSPRDERIWVFGREGIKGRHHETSVWDEPIIPTWARKEHKNEKPVRLMERLVSWLTDAGQVVLDPFAGSGTTGVACLRLGRRVILIEREPAYAKVCRERLEAEAQGLTLRDARAGQLSLLGGAP